MHKLYIPKKKIALASSFEGIFNNGALECAFVSINAIAEKDLIPDLIPDFFK